MNWYDNQRGHYVGPHHDDTHQMVSDSPIVTASFGVRVGLGSGEADLSVSTMSPPLTVWSS